MAKTLYSMGTMTAAEAWRDIRSIRAEPAGALRATLETDGRRRNEFHMALEQAQQQFAAAQQIGYESRPLNVFYGLSQAGRALAAGSNRLGPGIGQQWQASGHGIRFNVGVEDGLWNSPVMLQTNDRDIFSRVSIATSSEHDFESIKLGALVNQILDYTMAFREPEGFLRPLQDVRVYGASTSFPVEVEVMVPGFIAGTTMTADEVRAALAAYPALASLEIAAEGPNVRWSHNEGNCLVIVTRPDQFVHGPYGTMTLNGSIRYRGSTVVLPGIADDREPLRPLMTWWLVLHALSMLARYAPSTWMKSLSLAESPIASKIEFLLDTAVDAVPELLVEEIAILQS